MCAVERHSIRPLGLLPDSPTSAEELVVIEKIDRHEFPYVKERLLENGTMPEMELDDAILEFRKFFALACLMKRKMKSLAAISHPVDEVWHQFILFTKHYMRFCQDTVGHYVHHLPGTSSTPIHPESGVNLTEAYRKYFGELPAIWNSTQNQWSTTDW